MRVFGAEIQPSFVVSSFSHETVQQKQQQSFILLVKLKNVAKLHQSMFMS